MTSERLDKRRKLCNSIIANCYIIQDFSSGKEEFLSAIKSIEQEARALVRLYEKEIRGG